MAELLLHLLEPFIEIIAWIVEGLTRGRSKALSPGATESEEG